MSIREAIIRAASPARLRREAVDVEGLGRLWVRELTAGERDEWEAAIVRRREASSWSGLRAELLIRTLCDEDGAPAMLPEDVELLSGLPAATAGRLYDVAARLNRLTPEDAAELDSR